MKKRSRKKIVKSFIYEQEFTLKAFNNLLIDNEPTEYNCAGAVCIRCNEALTSKSRVVVSFSKFLVSIQRASRPRVSWRKDKTARKIDDAYDRAFAECVRKYGPVRGWDADTTEKARSLVIDRMNPFNGQTYSITKIVKGKTKPGSHDVDPVTGKARGGNRGRAEGCESRTGKVHKMYAEALEQFEVTAGLR